MKTIGQLRNEIYWMCLYDWIEYQLTEIFREHGWKEETDKRLEKALTELAEDCDVDYDDLWFYYFR